MLARIAARSSAMEHGYVYVHTPFVQLDHVGGQEDYMERFLNLGADEIDIRNITVPKRSFLDLRRSVGRCFGNGVRLYPDADVSTSDSHACVDIADKYGDDRGSSLGPKLCENNLIPRKH